MNLNVSDDVLSYQHNKFNDYDDNDDGFLKRDQLITILPIEKEAPNSSLWYHGRIDRLDSEDILKSSGLLQSFLVRESEKRPGSFVLSYLARDRSINHYKLVNNLITYFKRFLKKWHKFKKGYFHA
jgi:hypothetical protein